MLPSSEAIWLKASGRKSANWRNATGRSPARARPIEMPTIVDSLSGRVDHAARETRGQTPRHSEHVALGVLDVLAVEE